MGLFHDLDLSRLYGIIIKHLSFTKYHLIFTTPSILLITPRINSKSFEVLRYIDCFSKVSVALSSSNPPTLN